MGNSGGSLTTRSTGQLHQLMQAAGFTGMDDAEALADGWQVVDFAHTRRELAPAPPRPAP
ncbi:hypothetical protein ACIBKX_31325 [Streptomyces sp. NPDC050658]|uniref:hypothetical protein n=1 Tax=unclassified Streptomyces TaxID=2593676 RepID=UPI003428CD66